MINLHNIKGTDEKLLLARRWLDGYTIIRIVEHPEGFTSVYGDVKPFTGDRLIVNWREQDWEYIRKRLEEKSL